MILSQLSVAVEAFAAATGWTVKPEGACAGEVCVPLPVAARATGGTLDVATVADRLGMPLVRDDEHDLWALGPATIGGRALVSAQVPDFSLPDLDGRPFPLRSLRGQKVLITAWASWCGCREDLPVWAALREELHPRGVEVVTIAIDTGGPAAVRRWIEAAQPGHPALVDEAHVTDELLGFSNVPSVLWVDEQGLIVRPAHAALLRPFPFADLEITPEMGRIGEQLALAQR